MSNPNSPDPENTESFDQLFAEYEQAHARKPGEPGKQLEGSVIAVSEDSVFLDIGYKTEGVLPLIAFGAEPPKPGDKFPVTVKGRNAEGYYELSRGRVARVVDWDSLQKAFDEKLVIVGTVTGVVKGGLSVDVGIRAFMPASRSGTREASEMEKLVGQEIRCRIIKLDVADEDVVVDRRAVAEDEERAAQQSRYEELREGDVVSGTVRSLMNYGAFVDLGGIDGLLHVGEIAWTRIEKPGDVLSVGQQIEAKIIKIDRAKNRISLSLKQMQAHPWDVVPGKYSIGDRVRGPVTRLADFGAFVELEPGVEGLIHISEMSWGRKVRTPGDVVKPGETVEAVILGIDTAAHRIALGMKQALGDPWADAAQKFPVGSVIEGPVVSLTNFGAFVQLADGVEGMIHVSDISAEKRLNHPQDALKMGQRVKAQILGVDTEKRQMRLGMKQLVPTSLDEYLAESNEGDVVTGRIIDVAGADARVELGEGIQAKCRLGAAAVAASEQESSTKADLSSLTAMLQARWKGGAATSTAKPQPVAAGQIRSFRITKLDRGSKSIEVELA